MRRLTEPLGGNLPTRLIGRTRRHQLRPRRIASSRLIFAAGLLFIHRRMGEPRRTEPELGFAEAFGGHTGRTIVDLAALGLLGRRGAGVSADRAFEVEPPLLPGRV